MDAVNFSVTVEPSVYETMMCVMDTKNVLMDLMRQIVVRELKFACKRKAVNFTNYYIMYLPKCSYFVKQCSITLSILFGHHYITRTGKRLNVQM